MYILFLHSCVTMIVSVLIASTTEDDDDNVAGIAAHLS